VRRCTSGSRPAAEEKKTPAQRVSSGVSTPLYNVDYEGYAGDRLKIKGDPARSVISAFDLLRAAYMPVRLSLNAHYHHPAAGPTLMSRN
jgi:hypothetical protein